MRRRFHCILPWVLVGGLSTACQHMGAVADVPQSSDFQPLGSIVFQGGSASFDADRVVGPRINVSRRTDGSWGGTLDNQAIDVSVSSNRIAGSYINLHIEQTPGGMIITGQWQNKIMRFEFTPERAVVRTPTRSFTLGGRGDGTYGPQGELDLSGLAAIPHPPVPQFPLALVASFY